jgi:Ran GTPase-activating protein (RanGAP) involved in mRNA processing and transport
MAKQTNLTELLNSLKNSHAIELSGKNITDQDCVEIANFLKENKTINFLNLSQNRIGDQGAWAIANSLKVNKFVTNLNLNQNRIGDEGAFRIADSLKVNKSVICLGLDQNQIGDLGAIAIADSIKVSTTIDKVCLGQNLIGDQGACAIAASLKVNKTLTLLYLNHNQIGDRGATDIAKILRGDNEKLTYVRLDQNQIGAQGIEELKSYTSLNPKLRPNPHLKLEFTSQHQAPTIVAQVLDSSGSKLAISDNAEQQKDVEKDAPQSDSNMSKVEHLSTAIQSDDTPPVRKPISLESTPCINKEEDDGTPQKVCNLEDEVGMIGLSMEPVNLGVNEFPS